VFAVAKDVEEAVASDHHTHSGNMADLINESRHSSLLAGWAPIRRPLPEHFMSDGRLTDTAGLALPVIDEESLFEIAGFAIGVEEVPQGGAAFEDRSG
jgi:hypothetical protein